MPNNSNWSTMRRTVTWEVPELLIKFRNSIILAVRMVPNLLCKTYHSSRPNLLKRQWLAYTLVWLISLTATKFIVKEVSAKTRALWANQMIRNALHQPMAALAIKEANAEIWRFTSRMLERRLVRIKISDRFQETHVFKATSRKLIISSNTSSKTTITMQLRRTTGFLREGDPTRTLVQLIIHQALVAITILSAMFSSISHHGSKKSRWRELRAKSNTTSLSIKRFKTKKCLQVPCR